jgi:hypothetical protein
MSERRDIAACETALGGVEAERVPETIPVRRNVSLMGDMVRIRDRDSTGRLLGDVGYTPDRARRMAAMLIDGANRLDPPKPLAVVEGSVKA